jgi:hypothetical protein
VILDLTNALTNIKILKKKGEINKELEKFNSNLNIIKNISF